jgi:hypothetical protein
MSTFEYTRNRIHARFLSSADRRIESAKASKHAIPDRTWQGSAERPEAGWPSPARCSYPWRPLPGRSAVPGAGGVVDVVWWSSADTQQRRGGVGAHTTVFATRRRTPEKPARIRDRHSCRNRLQISLDLQPVFARPHPGGTMLLGYARASTGDSGHRRADRRPRRGRLRADLRGEGLRRPVGPPTGALAHRATPPRRRPGGVEARSALPLARGASAPDGADRRRGRRLPHRHRDDRRHDAGGPDDDADGRRLRRVRARDDPRADPRQAPRHAPLERYAMLSELEALRAPGRIAPPVDALLDNPPPPPVPRSHERCLTPV